MEINIRNTQAEEISMPIWKEEQIKRISSLLENLDDSHDLFFLMVMAENFCNAPCQNQIVIDTCEAERLYRMEEK